MVCRWMLNSNRIEVESHRRRVALVKILPIRGDSQCSGIPSQSNLKLQVQDRIGLESYCPKRLTIQEAAATAENFEAVSPRTLTDNSNSKHEWRRCLHGGSVGAVCHVSSPLLIITDTETMTRNFLVMISLLSNAWNKTITFQTEESSPILL